MGFFIFGYGVCRFFVEIFRVSDPQFVSFDNPNGYIYSIGQIGISMGQLLSIPMIFVGVLILFFSLFKKLE